MPVVRGHFVLTDPRLRKQGFRAMYQRLKDFLLQGGQGKHLVLDSSLANEIARLRSWGRDAAIPKHTRNGDVAAIEEARRRLFAAE